MTTDAELPRVVQVAGYRLVRGPDGVYVGFRAASSGPPDAEADPEDWLPQTQIDPGSHPPGSIPVRAGTLSGTLCRGPSSPP
jgi:hypothetical protein